MIPPLRVAHVMAGAPRGGAELFYERLVRAQSRQPGLRVLPVIRAEPGRIGRLRASGVEPVSLRFGGALDWRTRPALRRTLRHFAPDIAVAWMNRAASRLPQGDWVSAGRLGGFYDLENYRHCRHLIGNTRGLVRWMVEQGRDPATTHYVPNFADDLRGAAPAALPAGVSPGRVVLALGRLHRNKAFDVLIRAIARVPGASLLIAGEGPERDALEALIRAVGVADRVFLLGWRTDGAALLAASDVLCCPSRHEPLGNVVIEGFSADRPVVACDADGPCELIVPERNGLLVPREDDATLGAALARVLDDRPFAAGLARAGRATYEAEFSESVVLERWRERLTAMTGRG